MSDKKQAANLIQEIKDNMNDIINTKSCINNLRGGYIIFFDKKNNKYVINESTEYIVTMHNYLKYQPRTQLLDELHDVVTRHNSNIKCTSFLTPEVINRFVEICYGIIIHKDVSDCSMDEYKMFLDFINYDEFYFRKMKKAKKKVKKLNEALNALGDNTKLKKDDDA